MKRKFLATTIVIIIITTSIPLVSFCSVATSPITKNKEIKKWTFMVYDAADCIGTLSSLRWFMKNIRSDENVNIVILQDTYFGPAKIWNINKFGKKILMKRLGEIDTSKPETLKDFILYCKEKFPSQRYYLDIFDHGLGWKGTCLDGHAGIRNNLAKEKNEDGFACFMSPDQMQKALTETGGVDIISFIFPCNMATVEVAYELRECVDVFIGREAGCSLIDKYIYKSLIEMLKNDGDLSNIEIGEKVIEENKKIEEKHTDLVFSRKTISAIRTDKITNLVTAIDNLSTALLNDFEECKNIISPISIKLKDFHGLNLGTWTQVDIYELSERYLAVEGLNETIYNHLEGILDAFNSTVITEWHNSDWECAHGLSVNCPSWSPINRETRVNGWDANLECYSNCDLDFTNDTHWDEFLKFRDADFVRVDDDGSANFKSIQSAINKAIDGETIYILNGTYKENIIINKSIKLIGQDPCSTIIDGGKSGDVIKITSDNVELCFLNIRNSSDTGAGVSVQDNSTVIFDCNIFNNHFGLYLKNSSNNLIMTNKIEKNAGFGIYLSSSNNNTIEYNVFKENKRHASFFNSYKNNWHNRFDPNRSTKIIWGFRQIGKITLPCINIDKSGPRIIYL